MTLNRELGLKKTDAEFFIEPVEPVIGPLILFDVYIDIRYILPRPLEYKDQ